MRQAFREGMTALDGSAGAEILAEEACSLRLLDQALDRLVILNHGKVTLDETIDDLKGRSLPSGEGGFGTPAPDLGVLCFVYG